MAGFWLSRYGARRFQIMTGKHKTCRRQSSSLFSTPKKKKKKIIQSEIENIFPIQGLYFPLWGAKTFKTINFYHFLIFFFWGGKTKKQTGEEAKCVFFFFSFYMWIWEKIDKENNLGIKQGQRRITAPFSKHTHTHKRKMNQTTKKKNPKQQPRHLPKHQKLGRDKKTRFIFFYKETKKKKKKKNRGVVCVLLNITPQILFCVWLYSSIDTSEKTIKMRLARSSNMKGHQWRRRRWRVIVVVVVVGCGLEDELI